MNSRKDREHAATRSSRFLSRSARLCIHHRQRLAGGVREVERHGIHLHLGLGALHGFAYATVEHALRRVESPGAEQLLGDYAGEHRRLLIREHLLELLLGHGHHRHVRRFHVHAARRLESLGGKHLVHVPDSLLGAAFRVAALAGLERAADDLLVVLLF